MSSPRTPGPAGMNPGARLTIRLIIAVIACIALILPLTGAIIDFTKRVNTFETSESAALPETMSELVVDASNARVRIVTTQAKTGSASFHYRGASAEDPAVSVDVSGGVTTVGLTGLGDSMLGSNNDRVTLTVEVPESQAQELDVTSTSNFSHTAIDGTYRSVVAETNTGFLEADVVADSMRLQTSTGAVRASGQVGTADVDTQYGAVEIDDLSVSTKLTVDTDTGGVEARLGTRTLPTEGIDINGDTGAVELFVPEIVDVEETEATGYRLDTRSTNGSVQVAIDEAPAADEVVIPITVNATSGSVSIEYL